MKAPAHVLGEGYLNSLSEIVTIHNDLIDYARIDSINADSLAFKPSRPDYVLPELYYGTPVKVNVYNYRMGFRVLGGIVARSGKGSLKISDAEVLVATDRRQFLRIKTNATGEVSLINAETGRPAGRPVKVHIEDISLGGVQFSTPMNYELGSDVFIKMRLFEFYLELRCNIQRAIKGTGLNLSYYYGCQYALTAEEEETMYRMLLRLQQKKRARHME